MREAGVKCRSPLFLLFAYLGNANADAGYFPRLDKAWNFNFVIVMPDKRLFYYFCFFLVFYSMFIRF